MKKVPLFKFFSSLKLAVFSILLLATVLATATIFESLYGMRGSHILVYGTWWFTGVLCLLATNVACAALSRYPWKKTQTGFVITHIGILTILLGAFLTQQWGVDGNLPVVEGNQDNEAILNDLDLTVFDEATGKSASFPLREAATAEKGTWMQIGLTGEESLVVDQFIPRAVQNRNIIKSPVDGMGAPALHLELSSSRFRIDEWVLAQDPGTGSVLNLGPALVSFRPLWTKEDEKKFMAEKPEAPSEKSSPGQLLVQLGGKEYSVDAGGAMQKWKGVPGSGLEVRVMRYLPYAVVENNELVNRSNEPMNPTLQLELRKAGDNKNEPEKHTVFANFPEFNTLHGAKTRGDNVIGAKLHFVAKGANQRESLGMVGKNRGELRFAEGPDGRLIYRVFAANGTLNHEGDVKVGEAMPTGWMDLQFKILEAFPHAVEDDTPQSIEYIQGNGENFVPAVHIINRRLNDKRVLASQGSGIWLLEGMARSLSLSGHTYFVNLAKRKLSLPFQVFLEKFTVGTDPGTTKAASYESEVVVKDPANPVEQHARISMNEPLKYAGYTLYQASYQMEDGKPPVSIFAVNRDPGRFLKYLGSIIMVLGIILMFYLNPHYWNILLGSKKKVEHGHS